MGLVGNLRYMEIADFALGFAGIDLAGDDGRKLGQSPEELDTPFAWARGDPQPVYTHCERCGGRIYGPGMARGPGGWSPVHAIRHLFVRGQPENLCGCPGAQDSAYASTRRRPSVPLPLPSPGSLPAPAPTDAVKALPEDCPVRQAIEGKSRGAQVADGATQVVNGGAKVVNTAWQAGKFAWGVGRVAVKVILTVPRVIGWLIPDRREPDPAPPPATQTAGRPLPRP